MLRSVKDLQGYKIRARDGDIGSVREFLFDDRSWKARYMVADTGGWLTDRLVLIAPNALEGSSWANAEIAVSLTKDQIENSPPIYEDQPVSRQYEAEYFDYYGYPYYWGAPYAGTPVAGAYPPVGVPVVPPEDEQQDQQRGDPHLRSTAEVSGYDIHASDGDIGHVDDFLIDDTSWEITKLVVATRDWLPGKRVVISPRSVQEVSWDEKAIKVDARRDDVKSAPEYDPSITVQPDGSNSLLI